MAGHVFVMQGDVRLLRCDARLLSVFTDATPKGTWLHASEHGIPPASPPPDWPSGPTRAYWYGAAENGPDLWVAQVGLGAGRDLGWALDTVRYWLPQALERLRGVGRRVPDRAVPLLAMHLVASGSKNAARSMGDLVHRVLDVADEFVGLHEADVAIVAFDRKQYAALQSARQKRKRTTALPPALAERARELARYARSGHLCVLTGAGISMGAGLPSWGGLLERLATERQLDEAQKAVISATDDPLVQAETLARHYESLDAFHERVAAFCEAPRIALAHGVIASMPVNEVVTLNYDTLFELAANAAGREFDVIPHGRRRLGPEWLLKLHGCRTRPREIVLTKRDYERFEAHRLAFAGIVQSLLITRHMLFLGFGMSDPNVGRVIELVRKAAATDESAKKRNLGTVLTLDVKPAAGAWEDSFTVVRVHPHDGPNETAHRARLLEIMLDEIALEALDPYEFLLDGRFDGLLGERGRAVREAATRFAEELGTVGAGTPAGKRLLAQLEAMGLHQAKQRRRS